MLNPHHIKYKYWKAISHTCRMCTLILFQQTSFIKMHDNDKYQLFNLILSVFFKF